MKKRLFPAALSLDKAQGRCYVVLRWHSSWMSANELGSPDCPA